MSLTERLGDPVFQATLWTVAIAMAAATSCALVGVWLVLRRMSLLGDAISHAVLPGLVVGFLLSGTRELWPMLAGAAVAGLLTALFSELLRRHARLDAGASMGVVFTTLFALGVVLMSLYARRVDLDPGCVLYGALGVSALDLTTVLGIEMPRSFASLCIVLAVDVAFVSLLWKELKITAFDPALATTLGISAGVMHYLLMGMVACTTVAAFEAVGSILVIAMLIVPGATAHLLTDRLGRMLGIAIVTGWIAAIGGVWLADVYGTSEASMMTVVAGLEFGVVVLIAPRYGILARFLRRIGLALRILEEDILARLYRLEETDAATLPEPATGPRAKLAHLILRSRGELSFADGNYHLTKRGRLRARMLVRAHRVWERYLAEKLGLPLDHLHEPAHRMEHHMTPEFADALIAQLGDAPTDPHGRSIPGKRKKDG